MKKVIPFKKEIEFNTNISEITSIALEHTLKVEEEYNISGEFIVSGEYKLADTSVNTESFIHELPIELSIDDKYNISNIVIDIEDFYYEIINNKTLVVNIDVLIDKLVEKPLMEVRNVPEAIEEVIEEAKEVEEDKRVEEREEKMEENTIVEEVANKKTEEKSEPEVRSFFQNFDKIEESYSTYKVCIIREGDTIDTIIQNYDITKEELEIYNNLTEVNIGDKIIIPTKI